MSKWLCKEITEGFSKWFKFFCYGCALIWLLDLLPRLPDELSKPLVDYLLGAR